MISSLQTRATSYFQSIAGQVRYHSAGYVGLQWSGERIGQSQLEAFYGQVLELLQSTSSYKVLSEHGQRMPLSAEAQAWISQVWVPQAMQLAGFSYCAIVEGIDPIHRLSIQSVISASPVGLVYKRFVELEDAEQWLKTV